MTKYEKEQAQIRCDIDDWICQVCGKRATQRAHRFGQGKIEKKLWGADKVHHNFAIVYVCGLECNTKVDLEKCHNNEKVLLYGLIRDFGDKIYTTQEINKRIGVEW